MESYPAFKRIKFCSIDNMGGLGEYYAKLNKLVRKEHIQQEFI